ncbi:glycosyl hydrolase family 43 [Microcella alkaliphila]|uniref:Glycosyl hydrolase family 43 n=1 Tax=Microcella alkaliphila TaxID=279828 RepID=A0A4V6MD15_9MICO|nr:glycoside hydrolase family 43 protein [Microcella alkaliphila]RZT66489.1 glycosyl hydrolase family 43 [Microcella alkaliphila]
MPSVLPNPLIPGFNPDPSCVRVDDAYYLVTSSFEYLPGLPIYRSEDFSTWQHIGNVLDRVAQSGIADSVSGMGAWAPTIRYRDGTFYVIVAMGMSARGCVVFAADDPAGPWSDGVDIPAVDGIDPDLAWDEDGNAYVTYSAYRMRGDQPGRHDGIEQVRVDLATGQALEEPRSLWSGTGLQFPEAPHLYRRGEYWYLLIAEGGTERGHAASIARGPSIEGPFTSGPANPILRATGTSRPVQNTGHADLIEGPDGTDLIVALGVRPLGTGLSFSPLGRETFATTVEWVDGWPLVAPVDLAGRAEDFTEAFALGDPTDLADPGWLAVGRLPADVAAIEDGTLVLTGIGAGLDAARPIFIGRRQRHIDSETAILVRPCDGAGGLGLRYDERFHLTATARRGAEGHLVVTATAALPGIRQSTSHTVVGDDVELRLTTRRPHRLMPNDGAGGDLITLEATGADGATIVLAEWDGRFWSAETAASFTGRVVGPFAESGSVRFLDFAYRGNDAVAPAPSTRPIRETTHR